MELTLVKQVEQNLGMQPVQKIDPNTQDVKANAPVYEKHTVDQAALPAVLAGLYKFSTTEEGVNTILGGSCDNWTGNIFGDNTHDIVEHVANYAEASTDEAYKEMERIAAEAVAIINNTIDKTNGTKGLKDYLLGQRKDILTYLPAELHAGELLNDNTIDDRTNKMEGPLSSFMQKIGNLFTSSEGPAENKTSFKQS